MKKIWYFSFVFLLVISVFVWFLLITYPSNNLKIIACDVGQGDAFLVSIRDFQILVDGGPNDRVLKCLSRNMPFWDKKVEVVILSHPEKDHFLGLISVFKYYEVNYLFTTPLNNSSHDWKVLKDVVGGSDTKVLNPRAGDKYRLGLIYIDIFSPSEDFLSAYLEKNNSYNGKDGLGLFESKKDPNEFSLVFLLSYKNFDALFTGDINNSISDMMAKKYSSYLDKERKIEYLKVPHHGSKNGLSSNLLSVINPKVAVISVGEANPYGHPHEEIIKMLENHKIKIIRTDKVGDIFMETDGDYMRIRN